MRYRFTVHELEGLKIFLAEAVEYLQKVAGEALRLKVTPDTAQSRLIIDGIVGQLHTFKGQALFFGLMEMVMLIRQAQSMLEAMRCGHLQIDAVAVEVLLDTKNTLGEMTRELSAASAKFQGTEELEIELACAQEAQWLIGFIRQLLQKKPSTAFVLVPQTLVSKLPAIIHTSLVKLEAQPERCAKGSNGDSGPEIVSTVNESLGVAISKPTTVSDEKIEQMLTIIGELMTANNVFSQMSRKLMMEHNLPNMSREAKNVGQFVNRIAAELEEAVRSMGSLELRPALRGSRGLLVKVAGQLFILPLDHVLETLKVTHDRLVLRRGRRLLYHRGETLGVLSLAEVLAMTERLAGDYVSVVVVTNGQSKVGMLVDKLLTEQEILIKPLPDYLSNIAGIGGAAITGDGKVALVLNVRELVEKASEYKALA